LSRYTPFRILSVGNAVLEPDHERIVMILVAADTLGMLDELDKVGEELIRKEKSDERRNRE
jgi:hypothetical protein